MLGRQLSVSLTKAPRSDTNGAPVACTHPSFEEIAEIAQDGLMTAAHVVAVAYVGKRVLDTACQIAVIAAKAKLK
jgi:hypothetical protein